MNKQKSFTLIELLVVIAIIGLLSAIVLVSLNAVRAKARDTRRLSDMKQIIRALEMYYDENGQYPGNTDNDCGGWDVGNPGRGTGDPFIQPLVDGGYFSKTPIDPTDQFNSACSYRYYRYPTGGSNTCGAIIYVLGVYLENNQTVPDQMDTCYTQTWWQGDRWYAVMQKE